MPLLREILPVLVLGDRRRASHRRLLGGRALGLGLLIIGGDVVHEFRDITILSDQAPAALGAPREVDGLRNFFRSRFPDDLSDC
jgi:hypothetical protein